MRGGRARLPDEALDRHEALGDGIGGQKEAFQGHGSEQGWPTRGDEAGRCDLPSIDGKTHLGDGPDLFAAAGGLNGLSAYRRQLELVGQRTWDDEQRRAGVDEQVNRCSSTRGACDARGDVEESHRTAIVRRGFDQATVEAKIRR